MNEPTTGVVVVGGEHPGLGIARSLGRRGVPVCVIDDLYCISKFSRYATHVVHVPDLRDERRTVDSLLDVGREYGLKEWVLYPTRDETVAAIARHRERLAEIYRVTTPGWECVQWMWNKKHTYDRAAQLGMPIPRTFNPRTEKELEDLYPYLPLAIKPAVKENFFYATGAKAWRAETPDQLRYLFQQASLQISLEEILIQEIIPGDGQRQYSYCAFFRDGHAHSTLMAKRIRQHPREFGRAATYVETIEHPEIEELSLRFLRSIHYYGLVEVEFKQDPRDGQFKLLDVNARAWGFHSLGRPAGVDFPYILFADQFGKLPEPRKAPAGVGWLRAITDVPTVMSDLWDREFNLRSYLRSIRHTRTESVFAFDDPLPFFAEFAMLPYLVAKKYVVKSSKGLEAQASRVPRTGAPPTTEPVE